MKKPLLLLATALFCTSLATQAKDVDLAKVTCNEFLQDEEFMQMMIFWIDGYLSSESDNTVLSDAWTKKLGQHMGEYCRDHGKNTIMDAIKAMPDE